MGTFRIIFQAESHLEDKFEAGRKNTNLPLNHFISHLSQAKSKVIFHLIEDTGFHVCKNGVFNRRPEFLAAVGCSPMGTSRGRSAFVLTFNEVCGATSCTDEPAESSPTESSILPEHRSSGKRGQELSVKRPGP